ncbi:hypothetical protein E1193_10735 [Micromonospora sp. KC606]|uniref:hypothetical protein n=1 Tax=Micromonospora sp. KC606 TaxID=2530379 RepID=UPI0010457040|nr:hypothetical protein [Micromonospora sp. KC606]TDC82827.1 hypothetical protein E1193_10735 [Micromonospora sp. KC606]
MRWRLPFDPDGVTDAGRCADVVCLVRADGTLVVDPATGRQQRLAGEWSPVVTVGRRWLAVRGHRERETYALLDRADGRVVAELGPWRLITDDVPDGPGAGRPLLVSRELAGGRQLLGELDPATGEVRIRDVFAGGWRDCSHQAGRTLVCWRPTGQFGVWRLPS